jgi:tyrosine-protein phosphatase SIW14
VRTHVRLVREVAATVLLGLVAASATAEGGRSSVRIENFGRINANYYRGAQPHGRGYADLARLGIKTVINLTSDDAEPNERALAAQAGMRYVQIPMTTHKAPTGQQISQFLGIVNDPASQPVYVHCVGGKHRTGILTAIYRMTNDGWTADRAFAEMKQYKFGADFLHAEFKRAVYAYPAELARSKAAVTADAAMKQQARSLNVGRPASEP